MKKYLIVFEGFDHETFETQAYHSVIVKAESELEANLKLADYSCDSEGLLGWKIAFTRELNTISVIE